MCRIPRRPLGAEAITCVSQCWTQKRASKSFNQVAVKSNGASATEVCRRHLELMCPGLNTSFHTAAGAGRRDEYVQCPVSSVPPHVCISMFRCDRLKDQTINSTERAGWTVYELLGGFPQNLLRGKEWAKICALVVSIGEVPNALDLRKKKRCNAYMPQIQARYVNGSILVNKLQSYRWLREVN